MQKLIDYLSSLNTAENQWGLWVNPEDVDEFRIGQDIFENGGLLDGWIRVGSLDSLSFGFQSERDAFRAVIGDFVPEADSDQDLQDELLERFEEEDLDFQNNIQEAVDDYCSAAAEADATYFVEDRIPEILAEAQFYKGVYA